MGRSPVPPPQRARDRETVRSIRVGPCPLFDVTAQSSVEFVDLSRTLALFPRFRSAPMRDDVFVSSAKGRQIRCRYACGRILTFRVVSEEEITGSAAYALAHRWTRCATNPGYAIPYAEL